MKTLKLFAISLAFLFVSGSAFGQTQHFSIDVYEVLPMYCDGEVVDVIEGTATYQVFIHESPNNYWAKLISRNEFVSIYTGEVYREIWIQETDRYDKINNTYKWFTIGRWHGSFGTFIKCKQEIVFDADTMELIRYEHDHTCK